MSYEKLLHRQRVFLGTGETMEYSYRMNALTALREALVYYEDEIYQALVDDLNKSPYETYISEYGLFGLPIRYQPYGDKINGLLRFLMK